MAVVENRFHVTVASRYDSIDLVQSLLHELLERAEVEEGDRHWIDLALREAVANAIRHGNGEDPSKQVRVDGWIEDRQLVLEVSDQGEGFEPEAVKDPLEPRNLLRPSGRGLLYMRSGVDEVAWGEAEGGGTRVTLRKRLDGGPRERSRSGTDGSPGGSEGS